MFSNERSTTKIHIPDNCTVRSLCCSWDQSLSALGSCRDHRLEMTTKKQDMTAEQILYSSGQCDLNRTYKNNQILNLTSRHIDLHGRDWTGHICDDNLGRFCLHTKQIWKVIAKFYKHHNGLQTQIWDLQQFLKKKINRISKNLTYTSIWNPWCIFWAASFNLILD